METGDKVCVLVYEEGTNKPPCGLRYGTIIKREDDVSPNGKKIRGFSVLLGDKIKWYEEKTLILCTDGLRWCDYVHNEIT